LGDLHITAGSTLLAEDRGIQISYRMVRTTSLIFLEQSTHKDWTTTNFSLFRYKSDLIYDFVAGDDSNQNQNWGCAQQLVYWMVFAHYIKEIFEALAVDYTK